MLRLASVGGIYGVESVAAVAANELGLEVRVEAVLSVASRALVPVYYVVVVSVN